MVAMVTLCILSLSVFADYSVIDTSEESSEGIHELVKELSGIQNDGLKTWEKGNHILSLLEEGDQEISEYDYLWTFYALIVNTNAEKNPDISVEDFLEIADVALEYLSYSTGEWVYTDIGQFRIEVHTQAANAAAWLLRKTQPKSALAYADRALEYSGELYVLDTKVRILINLNEIDEAYTIVKDVLAEYPDFGDFQDFSSNPEYLEWLKSN